MARGISYTVKEHDTSNIDLLGMTETSTVVSSTSELDVMNRSSGSLLPGAKAKIIGPEGVEITEYEKPGELLVQAPSVVLGYLNNEKAMAETFVYHNDGRWIRTGDEALVTRAPSGNEHLVIVDRIKELTKVKVRFGSLLRLIRGLFWVLTDLSYQGISSCACGAGGTYSLTSRRFRLCSDSNPQ